jgi:hypothetical protein
MSADNSSLQVMNAVFSRALVSGTLAAAAVTIVASMASRRATGTYPAVINATSHALWGDKAADQDDYSWKYTATGLVTNYGASIFWALLYEVLAPRRRQASAAEAALLGAAVSAAAYVTDYHLVHKRLTPGFELRLPRFALAPIYAALAFGLCARDFLRTSKK